MLLNYILSHIFKVCIILNFEFITPLQLKIFELIDVYFL